MIGWDWFLSGVIIYGTFLLIKFKSWKGFFILALANLGYFIYWFNKHEYATMFLVGVFFIQDIIGIISWNKKK